MPGKQHPDSFIRVRSIEDVQQKSGKNKFLPIKSRNIDVQHNRENILKWYGWKAGGATNDPEILHPLPGTEKSTDPLICIGRKYATICQHYCNLTGRPFITLENLDALHSLAGKKFASLLFVGTEKHFHKGKARISKTIQIPWGFISGKDASEISFFFTKMLVSEAVSKQNDHNLLIDVISRRVTLSKSDHDNKAFSFNKQTLDVLLKKDWQNLTLYAHGEISHMLINSWVICGMNEHLKKPHEVHTEFCCQENSRRQCIRVHNKNISILYACELKTCHLQLFSCTSLNFSRRLTPQNISLFHSIINGYCASAVMTDRNVVVTEELIKLTHVLNCKGVSKGFLIRLLNDYEEYINHNSPYILIGDPACRIKIGSRKFQVGKPLTGKNEQVHIFKLNSLSEHQIIHLPEKEKHLVIRGKKYLTVCFENNVPSFFTFELKGRDHRSAEKFFKSVSLGYNIFKFLEENLDGLLNQHPEIKDTCKQVAILLKDYSGKIRTSTDKGFFLLESIRVQGIWNEALMRHAKLLKNYIDLWQRSFVLLLNEPSLFAYFGNLLSSNMIEKPAVKKFHCDYCGSILRRYSMNQPRQHITLDKVWCDLCGLRQLSIPENNCFEVIHTKKMIPGGTIPVTVKLNPSLLREENESFPLHVMVSLYNKSREKEICREYVRTTEKEVFVSLKIPSRISYDLHVVGVVCLWAPYVQYYRSRISTMF